MWSERGQASIEWIAVIALVAISLGAVARFARRDEDDALATTLAHAATCAARDGCRQGKAFTAPPLVPGMGWRAHRAGARPLIGRALLEWARGQVGRDWARPLRRVQPGRLGRGAGRAWRRAWFACLVYERIRWAILHPESRSHEYEFPPSEAIRILNDCISPVDLVRDWPLLTTR